MRCPTKLVMPENVTPAAGTYIGFDFGTKNIGVAVGQTVTLTANPLTTLKAKNGIPDWTVLGHLLTEWRPRGLIVGLARQPDGSHSPTSLKAQAFGKKLWTRFQLPIYYVEERLTSVAASHTLKQNKDLLSSTQTQDAIAAMIILESWFNDLKGTHK